MTPKQQRFVDEYLIDLNATQAAIRAGYSPKTAIAAGSRLLTYDEVKAGVVAGQAARAERIGISQDYVLENLTEVVERCMQRAPVMVREGKYMVQLQDEDGKDVWQFDSRGVLGALNLVGKHLKMFTDKIEHSVDGSLAELMRAAEERIARRA